ncbi:MAG: YhbY family RNA-binding protein [Clostridia bacterium]|nr:YhbY family RNA-binding protein [Clostridia bacterium]
MVLSSRDRAYLRSEAGKMTAIMQVGKEGVTPALLATLGDALEARELIKLSVLETCPLEVKEALEVLSTELKAVPVAAIGRKVILFRPSSDKSRRNISLKLGGKTS